MKKGLIIGIIIVLIILIILGIIIYESNKNKEEENMYLTGKHNVEIKVKNYGTISL